jgi:hypothetical protein
MVGSHREVVRLVVMKTDFLFRWTSFHSWMGDNKLALMDVNTESTNVQTTLANWISSFVQEYEIDGLRIDGELFSALKRAFVTSV